MLAEKESKIVLAKLDATEEGSVAEKFKASLLSIITAKLITQSYNCISIVINSKVYVFSGARLPYPQVLPQWESYRIWRRQVMLLILLY